MKQIIPYLIPLVLIITDSANSQEARWNLGATPEERADTAKKLLCGNPPERPASAISVVQVVRAPQWQQAPRSVYWVTRMIPMGELSLLNPANPDQRSAAEREWKSNYATRVYSSLTIDCFIAALTKLTFNAQALSKKIVERLDRSEAEAKTITNENYIALLARVEQLEDEVKRLKDRR
ncbi:hypothetical protein GOB57_22150 [Sinorhizobium meliloti]|nr:hypothetical protein [Sinorhizobium meliloti]